MRNGKNRSDELDDPKLRGGVLLLSLGLAIGAMTVFGLQQYAAKPVAAGMPECWSLASEFRTQEGWQRAHRADKFANRKGVEIALAPAPDLVCAEVDKDGLPVREFMARSWWWRPLK